MRMRGNTMLITGGTSGIGRGLAEAFHGLGNQVIVAGRRADALEAVCAANPGMRSVVLDVTDPAAVRAVADRVAAEFPTLNCVFSNAGIQKVHDFAAGGPIDEEALRSEVETNFLGVVRVASAFLPLLRGKPGATLVNVSSALALVPLAFFPVYCATKAAVHSFTMSLRHQARGTGVRVVELTPPYVATELDRAHKAVVPGEFQPMPLEAFIAEAMRALEGDDDEVAVGMARELQAATGAEGVRGVFAGMNR